MQYHKTPLMMLAASGLLLTAGLATAADSSPTGVVRLGHHSPSQVVRGASAGHCDRCDGYGDGYGAYGNSRSRYLNGRYGGGFGSGSCRHSSAARQCGGRNGFGGNPHYSSCGIGDWLNKHSPYHRCTHSPDYGFAPPAQRPIWPTPAEYRNQFPASWTGQELGIDPGFRHPMVYMPTDTTQLGFYYQTVPYWRPRRGMIPPVPHPAEWHTPDTGVVFTGFEDAVAGSHQNCRTGHEFHGPVIDGSISDQGIPIESVPSEALPSEASPVPMIESAPYSPEPNAPIAPKPVPPAGEAAPVPPSGPNVNLEKSASVPQLVSPPRQ